MNVLTGIDRLISEKKLQQKIKGNIALLCHAASVDRELQSSIKQVQKIFGSRLKKLFGPQHGLITDVQDNMIESHDSLHPYFKLPIHSLYSQTRAPTAKMLEGIDTVLIDLQDVGTRVYTYISTLTLFMEACSQKDIAIVVLDRPNPINGIDMEGNILDMQYKSFVGRYPSPMRHSLTIGEVALWVQRYYHLPCQLDVVTMKNWKRRMSFEETGLPWVMPSPNLPTVEAAYTFVGTVLFEGTNISEGRGTTRSLEILGHPKLEPFSFLDEIEPLMKKEKIEGLVLRPLWFMPTFNKHQNQSCGGFQIHVTDRALFKPWVLCQWLCQKFYHRLGEHFVWKVPPYEYEFDTLPIDIINGTDRVRKWIESNGPIEELRALEKENLAPYLEQRENILLYS